MGCQLGFSVSLTLTAMIQLRGNIINKATYHYSAFKTHVMTCLSARGEGQGCAVHVGFMERAHMAGGFRLLFLASGEAWNRTARKRPQIQPKPSKGHDVYKPHRTKEKWSSAS